jgi:O-antigen/teichoic acid export membrane protein
LVSSGNRQDRSLENSTVRQIGGAAVLIALGLSLVMVLTAPIAAGFYSQPVLTLMLPVMSIRLLIDAFAVVPRSVLVRDLEFRKLSLLEGVESIVIAAVTVGAAWLTRSYWSFILGNLVSGVFFVVAVTAVARTGPAMPRTFAAIRRQVEFGSNVVVSRVAWYAYINADFAIVGRVMNAGLLGLYTFAWSIASLPAEKLSGLVIGVAPSIMSAARSTPSEIRRYYLLLVRGVSLLTFPVAVGLALVARDLVDAIFGATWAGAVPALQLLSLFFGVRALATLAPVVMISSGHPKVDRNFSLTFLVILPPLFLLASRWGITAVAATWLVAYPVLFAMLGQRWVLRHLKIGIHEFVAELWPAVVGVGFMAGVVVAVSKLAVPELPSLLRLVLLSLVGAMMYLATIRTLFRPVFDAALDMVWNRRSVTGSNNQQPDLP